MKVQNSNTTILRKNIFSDEDANRRIRIKKAYEKTEAERIKGLSKKPLTLEEKIINTTKNL